MTELTTPVFRAEHCQHVGAGPREAGGCVIPNGATAISCVSVFNIHLLSILVTVRARVRSGLYGSLGALHFFLAFVSFNRGSMTIGPCPCRSAPALCCACPSVSPPSCLVTLTTALCRGLLCMGDGGDQPICTSRSCFFFFLRMAASYSMQFVWCIASRLGSADMSYVTAIAQVPNPEIALGIFMLCYLISPSRRLETETFLLTYSV